MKSKKNSNKKKDSLQKPVAPVKLETDSIKISKNILKDFGDKQKK